MKEKLKEKILVVVDMQEDFISQGGALSISKDTTNLLANFKKLLAKPWATIIFTMDTHDWDDCEFGVFPIHCVKGTKGWNLIKEAEGTGHCIFMEKKTFSSFEIVTRLTPYCQNHEIHFAGVCTHICVHDIITGLVNVSKEALNTIPDIVVHKDCIGDFDDEMAAFAIKRLENLYGVKFVEEIT